MIGEDSSYLTEGNFAKDHASSVLELSELERLLNFFQYLNEWERSVSNATDTNQN